MPRRMIRNTGAQSFSNGEQAQFQADAKGHLKVSSGSGVVLDFTPTLDTNIYADNDVLFISAILTGVSDTEAGVVRLTNVTLFDGDDQGTEVELFLTTSATTPGTINGALSAADTVFDDIVGSVSFATFSDLINSQVSVVTTNQIMQCAAGSKDLYVFGVVRSGTPTYTAAGMKIKFAFERL